jgi:hypothetical protein
MPTVRMTGSSASATASAASLVYDPRREDGWGGGEAIHIVAFSLLTSVYRPITPCCRTINQYYKRTCAGFVKQKGGRRFHLLLSKKVAPSSAFFV